MYVTFQCFSDEGNMCMAPYRDGPAIGQSNISGTFGTIDEQHFISGYIGSSGAAVIQYEHYLPVFVVRPIVCC